MKYRNITDSTVWVEVRGRLVEVTPDGVVETSDDDSRYWQTGKTGETALWAVVDQRRRAASAAESEE